MKERTWLGILLSFAAPCRGKITEEEYNEAFQEALDFIKGGSSSSVKVLTEKMEQAAENLEFELAAALRDQIIELKGQS